jgi:DNA-binding Lrp family transcriptional regulator
MDLHIIENVCASHPKAKKILRYANGKRGYKDIAKLVGVHPTKCSSVLRSAHNLGLLAKVGKFYKMTPEFKAVNLNRLNREATGDMSPKISPKVRKPKKIVDTQEIKKVIKKYLTENFSSVSSPFSNLKVTIHKSELEKAAEVLFQHLAHNIAIDQLDGLSLRFYESFAAYFSCSRIAKAELINAFSNMIKCFEPYLKKVAAIKSGDMKYAKMSLNAEVVKNAIPFVSDIDKHQNEYWQDKPVHEACIRFVYPFRHKEAHEARDYTSYEIEKIVFYMFASIIFVNLAAK